MSSYIFVTKARIDKKILLSSNISHICRHNTVNFGPLTAEIRWRVWGTRTNFNGLQRHGFVAELHRRRSTEVNQTFHDVWPSPALVYTIGGLCPVTKFCQLQNSLCAQVLLSINWHVTAWHSSMASAKVCDVVQGMKLRNFRRGRHLYSAGRPSRWASAHIIVIIRPHRSTTYVDAAYCYRPSGVVCRSACLSVTQVSPAKTAEPIEMPFGLRTRVGPGNHVLDGVQMGRGNFPGGRSGVPL